MRGPVRFPIRMKFLITLLFVVTGVVSCIVFTMANLFHEDKRAYISDSATMTALGAAEECRSILVGYQQRLHVYARVIGNDDLSEGTKAEMLREFFDDFPELVAISLETGDHPVAAAYNGAALEEAGLSKSDLLDYRREHPLPVESILHLPRLSLL